MWPSPEILRFVQQLALLQDALIEEMPSAVTPRVRSSKDGVVVTVKKVIQYYSMTDTFEETRVSLSTPHLFPVVLGSPVEPFPPSSARGRSDKVVHHFATKLFSGTAGIALVDKT